VLSDIFIKTFWTLDSLYFIKYFYLRGKKCKICTKISKNVLLLLTVNSSSSKKSILLLLKKYF